MMPPTKNPPIVEADAAWFSCGWTFPVVCPIPWFACESGLECMMGVGPVWGSTGTTGHSASFNLSNLVGHVGSRIIWKGIMTMYAFPDWIQFWSRSTRPVAL